MKEIQRKYIGNTEEAQRKYQRKYQGNIKQIQRKYEGYTKEI